MFNEREVVPRILKGDMQAFTLLVKQYEKLVFLVISRLINNREETADVCQEVFIKVYKGLGGFSFQSRLSTWIARIAYLTAVNHLKKRGRHAAGQYPENLDQYHFTTETPEALAERKDTAAWLNRLIEQMPEQYRVVLTLYHLSHFSYPEITAITGMPEGTVKSYLFRARKLLKDKLQAYLKNEKYEENN